MEELWYCGKATYFIVPSKAKSAEVFLLETSFNSAFPENHERSDKIFSLSVVPGKKYFVESIIKGSIWYIRFGKFRAMFKIDKEYSSAFMPISILFKEDNDSIVSHSADEENFIIKGLTKHISSNPSSDDTILYIGSPISLFIPSSVHYLKIEIMKYHLKEYANSLLECCGKNSYPKSFSVRVGPKEEYRFLARINMIGGDIEIHLDERIISIPAFFIEERENRDELLLERYVPVKLSWRESEEPHVNDWNKYEKETPDVAFNIDFLSPPEKQEAALLS